MENDIINVQLHLSDGKGMFFIEKEGVKIALMTFRYSDNLHIIVDHTRVNDLYKNKGYAKLLLKHVINYAKEHQLIIIPVCSFVRHELSHNPEYKNIAKEE